jgi:hypothetical protein
MLYELIAIVCARLFLIDLPRIENDLLMCALLPAGPPGQPQRGSRVRHITKPPPGPLPIIYRPF